MDLVYSYNPGARTGEGQRERQVTLETAAEAMNDRDVVEAVSNGTKTGSVVLQQYCTTRCERHQMIEVEQSLRRSGLWLGRLSKHHSSRTSTTPLCSQTSHRVKNGSCSIQVGTELHVIEGLRKRTEYIDIFLFPPIIQSCSVPDVLFTGGRGVSDFSVLKYH